MIAAIFLFIKFIINGGLIKIGHLRFYLYLCTLKMIRHVDSVGSHIIN